MDLIVGLDHLNLLVHRRRGACAPPSFCGDQLARELLEPAGSSGGSRGRHHQLHLTSTTDRSSVEHPLRLAAASAFRLGKRSNACAAAVIGPGRGMGSSSARRTTPELYEAVRGHPYEDRRGATQEPWYAAGDCTGCAARHGACG